MKLKRTNWTTEEVIKLIDGLKLVNIDGSESSDFKQYNQGVESAKRLFEDFLLPENEFGAIAYDSEADRIYHTGKPPSK